MPAGVKFEISGRPLIMCDTLMYIVQSQLGSFGTACLVIFIALSLLFRSVKLGLICMVPNVFPILVMLGIMGFIGLELDVATSMVAATVIGIAVDDTIHFVWNLKKRVEVGSSYEVALEHVFKEAGFSAFSATFIVCTCFLGLTVSQLWPTTYFGILTSLACLLALIAELFLTPTLLLLFKPIKTKIF